VFPASFMLTDRLDHIEGPPFPVRGAFADVYKATYKGHLMAVKAFKTTSVEGLENLQKVSSLILGTIEQDNYINLQRLVKGILGWRWLRHKNILPFVGITPPPISTVSPWMENGTIVGFVKAHPKQNPFSLVGFLCFILGNTDQWHSLLMRPVAYNTFTNMNSSMGTSGG